MMTESVQPTGAPVRLESLSIEMEPRKGRVEALCDKYCSENMETKTKVYICLLLILPSLIYFLATINFSSSSHRKSFVQQTSEKPPSLNITTFSEEKFTAEEYAEAFDYAVKNDQLVMPTGFTSQSLKRYISTSSRSINREEENDDDTVYLLGRS